jgi:hypothetical protein
MVLLLFPPPTFPIAERIGTPTAVLQEQDRGETGLIYQKVSVCRGTQQTLIFLQAILRRPAFQPGGRPLGGIDDTSALLIAGFSLGESSNDPRASCLDISGP